MNLSAPVTDVAPGVRGALLQALARFEQPVTRRQLARAASVTSGHGSRVVDSLIDAGLVTEISAGRASLVALNREHLAAPHIIALAGLRGELIRRLRERFSDWDYLVGAWLFGSVARGDAHQGSDIDVLLVATDLESSSLHEQLTSLQADAQSWTGNVLQFVEHSVSSWERLRESGNPLVGQIRDDGIPLMANDPSLLRRQR
jgi:predicted nucleotidyltransferase